MAKFFIVFAACVALVCGAPPEKEAAAASTFEELSRHAAEFQKTFSEQVSRLTSSENTAQLNSALKEGSASVLHQLSAFSQSLQAALADANGKAKEAVEQTRTSVARAADELRQQHPEVEVEAAKLKEQIEKAVSTAAAETQKLAQKVAAEVQHGNQELAPKIKKAYEDFVKNAQQVQEKLHEAATSKQ